MGQAEQTSESGGVLSSPVILIRKDLSSGNDAKAFSWSILIFVAPTVMAIAIASFNSSSVIASSLATARQYRVQASQPAASEAPNAIKCFVFLSRDP